MSSNPAPPLFQNQNPNYPNHNPHAYLNPLPYPQPDPIFRPPPPPSVVTDPNSQFSFAAPHSFPGQPSTQNTQEQEAYYSYLAAYAASQVNQQLYATSSSSYGAVQPGITNTTAGLQIKKMKVLQGGAPADSVRTCEICNVVCNSDKVFASHLAGEKHKLKIFGRQMNYASKPMFTKKTVASTSKVGVNFVRSTFCDLCKVTCNSQEAFNTHVSGKKHQTNMQKVRGATNPSPAKTGHGMGEAKAPTLVDLEAKKMKVVSGGAAASAVKVCTYCNVVCNSQEVYNSHVVGKRHIANVGKLLQPAPPA